MSTDKILGNIFYNIIEFTKMRQIFVDTHYYSSNLVDIVLNLKTVEGIEDFWKNLTTELEITVHNKQNQLMDFHTLEFKKNCNNNCIDYKGEIMEKKVILFLSLQNMNHYRNLSIVLELHDKKIESNILPNRTHQIILRSFF